MKITLITQYYKPEMGAPQNRLYEMCSELKKLGADISIITGMPNYPTGKVFNEYKGKFSTIEVLDDIEIKRYWLYASNTKKVFPRIWNMISFSMTVFCALHYLRKRKNDFIIVESPPLTLGATALILSKLTGAKLVMNISDLWPLSARELGVINGDSFIYKVLEWLEHHLYKNAVFCMGQSQEIVDYIAKHGAKEVYLFRNGVDPRRFSCNDIQKTNTDNAPLKIVYAGLLGFAQGIGEVCKNVNFKEAKAEFHIYGAGGEQQQIIDYIATHPDCNIYYHGKVDSDEIPMILRQADCTLVPLVRNIFGAVPSKIYESMAAGLPILFSGDGEGMRIVKENNLGWVSPALDYKLLEINIKSMTIDRKDWATKKSNCVDCAKNKFNRPKQVEALYDYMLKKI